VSNVDKDLLFKPRLPEEDVELPGVGTIRVRGLSRIEGIHVQAASGVEATERRALALGMVEPTMTEEEVGRWQRAAPVGELQPVAEAITRLSGMDEGSPKAAVIDFETSPETEF
jgi:hypothetical protein